jgi:hypothetical protein
VTIGYWVSVSKLIYVLMDFYEIESYQKISQLKFKYTFEYYILI